MSQSRFVVLNENGAPLASAETASPARLESARGLMWGPTLDDEMSWEDAKRACAEFRLFGFDDWRLPTREELLGLVDLTRFNPATDAEAFPDTESDWYWTSSPLASSPGSYAWIVNFNGGGASGNHHYYECFVRPVRSVAVPGQ
jgi:hypothetical protein